VDILAHPGLITRDEADIAARNGIFLEVSARRGHSTANGHVARVANQAGARMVLNSDAHGPQDLLTEEFAMNVALGAGLDREEAESLLGAAPLQFLKKVGVDRGP
jgi:histidinol phosphatase-like PHP family hydrolase